MKFQSETMPSNAQGKYQCHTRLLVRDRIANLGSLHMPPNAPGKMLRIMILATRESGSRPRYVCLSRCSVTNSLHWMTRLAASLIILLGRKFGQELMAR